MTHPQYQSFWREVCEAYSKPFDERTGRQLTLTNSGLCWALSVQMVTYDYKLPEFKIIRIFKSSNQHSHYWGFDGSETSNHHRSIAAGLLAAMSASDVKEFTEQKVA